MGDGRDKVAGCSKTAGAESAKAKGKRVGNQKRTNKIGPTTKTKIATNTTSRIMAYITLSTPKVNHQRCGEDCRHVFDELYRRIWTSTNQTRVKVEPMSDSLTFEARDSCNVMCRVHA